MEELELLLARGHTGDRGALSALIQRYQGAIAGLVRSQGIEPSAVEDVCQGVFVKMVLGLKRLRAGSAFEPWLFQIARNACRDHQRRDRWRRLLVEPFENRHAQVPALVPPELEAGGSRLEQALARLDVREKDLVALTLAQPRSYAELAQILGVSIAATRSRLFRARQHLAELMREGDCADEP